MTLSSVSLDVRPGQLAVIVGPAASGKSTLLQGLLGEAAQAGGAVQLGTWREGGGGGGGGDDPVAYVPQTPWVIAGATVAENIVLGRPLDEARLDACVRATALVQARRREGGEEGAGHRWHLPPHTHTPSTPSQDLAAMPLGLHTVVSGSTLSGGQKQRLSLARAAYSSAPLILIDDCFAALDPLVARLVFENCVVRLLAGRTRVVVTRMPAAAAACDVLGLTLPAAVLRLHPVAWADDPQQGEEEEGGRAAVSPPARAGEVAITLGGGSSGGGLEEFSLVAAPREAFERHPVASRLLADFQGNYGVGAAAAAVAGAVAEADGGNGAEVTAVAAAATLTPPPEADKGLGPAWQQPPAPLGAGDGGSSSDGARGTDEAATLLLPAEPLDPGAGLPIVTSWFVGIGGLHYAATYLALLVTDAAIHLGGN